MRGYTTGDRITYWLFQDRIPVTKMLIVANLATFIAIALFKMSVIGYFLGFNTATALLMPWTFVTYPLVGAGDIIGLLFGCYWLWVAGGSLERSWSSARFGAYFFLMCAISTLGIWAGAFLIHAQVPVIGLWLPLAGVTISWAMLNPEQQILFFFVIPMKLKYLALLDVVLVLVSYGQMHLLLGLFALIGCAFSYWYILPHDFGLSRNRGGGQVVRVHRRRSFLHKLNPFALLKDKREKDRLRKLFEDSFGDDEQR
ncbi:MAG: rhomboid family intramembrane serine protease [Armatimonadota bacterium]|nr:rhomboid family intramembrane serine protease [bacterium]